jgi:hypothetical protein
MSRTGAAGNPFRTERIDRLAFRLDDAGWEALIARLAATAWRGAIVGPHGTGKTTCLDGLAPRLADRLAARGLRVRRVDVRPEVEPVDAPTDILLLDGLERLGWWRRRRWLAACRCAGAVATLHRDGPLPTVLRTTTSPALLADLMAEALGRPLTSDEPAHCAWLYAAHQGDLRACLRALYDEWARTG